MRPISLSQQFGHSSRRPQPTAAEVRSAHADERSDGARAAFQPVGTHVTARSSCRLPTRNETVLTARSGGSTGLRLNEMRRAIARTRAARMTAEGDGLALFIAALGVTAIARSSSIREDAAVSIAHATQLDRLDLLNTGVGQSRQPSWNTGSGRRLDRAVNRLGGHRRFRRSSAPASGAGAPERSTASSRTYRIVN